MAGPVEGGGPEGTDDREETPPPLTKEQIEGHVSALKSLIKSHNRKNKGDPICLDFETEDTETQDHNIAKGKEVVDEDLRKPFKEARRTPFTRRIIEFAGPEYKMPTNIKLYDGTTDPEDHLSRFAGAANSGEWPMPVWCRMFQQTLDGSARGWFERLPHDSINEWAELRDAFAARYSVRRACFKEPHEITKIVRKANESLTAFKERWTVETGFIMGVPKVMKISSFMDSVKSPELAKHFSDKVPTTVNEMMERLDDFVRSEVAYANTELPKGETGETHRKVGRDEYRANRARDDKAPYPFARGEYNRRVAPVRTLNSLTKHPKGILATETQLRLPAPRPMINPLRSGNTDRYCDYHQEKCHYKNDCIQLRKQLEMALESGKLNHLVKDVRQRGKGSHARDDPQPAKIINVISVNSVKDKNQKVREATESWMNVPISFPAIPSDDISEEPLIVEAEVEGYLARLRETQTDLVGFTGEVSKPLGKIELEVCFGNGGLCRRTSMKFIVVRAPSPYNVILGRPRLKTLRAIPSTIHSMMKFPTPKWVATLVTRTVIIAEYRRLERKQMIEEERPKGEGEVAVTEEVLVNPSFPDQLVTIRGGLSDMARD
ncbi:reverse transcriptase domain-containing protein [Tanacetum coccineum]